MSERPQVVIIRKDAGAMSRAQRCQFRRRRSGKINRIGLAYLSKHPSRHAPDIDFLKLRLDHLI